MENENIINNFIRLRTPNEGINQRYLKVLADVADKAVKTISSPGVRSPCIRPWRLWAEIKAHKWRDFELNLSKTTLSLFKPTA